MPTSIPKLKVDWYAQDGIFNSPQIIGVGERGPEAVVPLANNAEWINSLAERITRQNEVIRRFELDRGVPESDSGGTWNIILQRSDGTVEKEISITSAERRNRRGGTTIFAV